jgi:hypothetical protein
MTAPRKGPKAGSRAYLALVQLHKDGGQADTMKWMQAAGWAESAGHFGRVVVKPLLQFRLVISRGTVLALTDSGLTFLGATGAVPMPEPVITPPAYVAPIRALSIRHRPAVRVIRAGAFEYRDIPSLQADKRTPFQSSLQVGIG